MYVYFTTDQASTVSYTVSAEGYPDYTANAITSDEAAAAYREAAAGDADGSGNVGGTSTASQTTTVSSNDIASTEHEFLVLGLIPKVKNTITLTITDTDGNATTRTIEQTGPKLLARRKYGSNRPSPPTNPRSPRSAMACTRFSAMIPTSRISCTTMTRTV
nr:aryl-sulfate sulfotransferase N-terminal domain-containing protein [Bifidobacterium longum]